MELDGHEPLSATLTLVECSDISPRMMHLLADEVQLAEAIVRDEAHILPIAEDAALAPRQVFRGNAMRRFMEIARNDNDPVIFDCAPMIALGETRAVVSRSDAVIMVAKRHQTAVRRLRRCRTFGDHARARPPRWLLLPQSALLRPRLARHPRLRPRRTRLICGLSRRWPSGSIRETPDRS